MHHYPKFLLSAVLLITCGVSFAHAAPNSPLTHAPIRLGTAWYPEQWPEQRWDADLVLMEQAHMNVVRIGEFAWSTLEPSEGQYHLDWMARAIDLAAKHHIAVVIGTPTDAPPAWLTTKYPETLGTDADGHLREHGNRRQFNYANPHYRALCAAIVNQLARRFGHNPDVIGWQIGNEYTDESFDPATRAQFQQFLRHKYKTLDNLNHQWAATYWSQTYTAWSQIPMESTRGNPGLLLDHKHFVTDTWRSFQRNQIDVLRPLIAPAQFITTNIGGLGWSDNWDHYAITADLDLASWDDYVGQGHLLVSRNAMLNDFVRGWKRQNFWVMETEPGSVNWAPINNALDRGETRALAWQAIGHGADAILYWQWRSALNGQEEYHGTLIGADGNPVPVYSEIQQLGHDLKLTRTAIAGTSPHSEVAILHDYDSRWAIDFQPHTREYDQQQVLLRFYTPLEQFAQSVDVISAFADLGDPNHGGYKFVVAPSLNVIPQALADRLLAYVRAGGHLLLGPRSGMKDQFNSLNPQRQPGPLAPALGGRVEQFYALDAPVPLTSPDHSNIGSGTASIWAEQLSATSPDTHIGLTYGTSNGWLDNQPAMISRTIGKGTISYLGTLPDPALMSRLLTERAAAAGITPAFGPISKGVEVCRRSDTTHTVYILINHGNQLARITLPTPMHNLLANSTAQLNQVDLPKQDIAILTSESPR